VADWDGLENRSRCEPTVGSNPTPSAPVRGRQRPTRCVKTLHFNGFGRVRNTLISPRFHVVKFASDRQIPTRSVPSVGKGKGKQFLYGSVGPRRGQSPGLGAVRDRLSRQGVQSGRLIVDPDVGVRPEGQHRARMPGQGLNHLHWGVTHGQ
jgi:hypothetical protein